MVLIFLDAIYYPQRENKNLKLLLNVTSHVSIISQFKKNTCSFFVFLLSLRKFFNVVMISSCKQELAAINLEICYSQCLGRIRCCRIWTLFPSKSQMFSSPHDVCFSCAWDSSFGKNGDDQSLFVGWFELHWLAMSSQVLMRLSSPAHHRTPSSLL